MCGINGYIGTKANISNIIQSMNNEIIHRGPDDDGIFLKPNESINVALGMRRLSIIDLQTGKQPMISRDKSIVIIFNGEIYNYLTLKQELVDKGLDFLTNSDTEIILKLYETEGINCVDKLDGMYSFAIYDTNLNKVFITRDFFGEKPMYYTQTNDSFYFASELKSIIKVLDKKAQINLKSLNLYFQLTYIPAPFTIYDNIYKLEPGSIIEYDVNNLSCVISKKTYKTLKFQNSNFKDIVTKTKDLVFESVISRSVSDVPIGTFLSGGVDSSIVSYCLSESSIKKIDTFSIGFENKKFDESNKSKLVSKIINSNHHSLIVREEDLMTNFTNILSNFDEPFADSSALPSYLLAEYTSKYVKVALTGDGADEIFSGYNKHYIGKLNSSYTSLINKKLHDQIYKISSKFLINKNDDRGMNFKINKFLSSVSYNNEFYFKIISLGFKEEDLKNLLISSNISENSLFFYKNILGSDIKTLKNFRQVDLMLSLEGDMLTKVDRTSMLASLECRSPFLNRKILDWANYLPDNLLIKGFNKKYILKEAFKEHFPTGFLDINKQGFGIPIGDWLKTVLKNELLSFCEKNFIHKQSIFNHGYIQKMVNDHLESKSDNTFKIWTFFCFQHWFVNTYEKS